MPKVLEILDTPFEQNYNFSNFTCEFRVAYRPICPSGPDLHNKVSKDAKR